MALTDDEGTLLWRPSDEIRARANFTCVLADTGYASYEALTQSLLADDEAYERFYRLLLRRMDVRWTTPPARLRDLPRGEPFARFFPGARYQAAANCVDRWIDAGRGGETALIAEDEAGASATYTYAELQAAVRACALALAGLGVARGDTVGLWMPMVAEAAIALLAIGYLGAIAVPAFSGYGGEALAVRLRDAGARVLVAADTTGRRGKYTSTLAVLRDALREAPAVREVVLWTRIAPPPPSPKADSDAAPPERTVRRRGKTFTDVPADSTLHDLGAPRPPRHEPDAFDLQAEEATVGAFGAALGGVAVRGWRQQLLARRADAARCRPVDTAADDPYLLLYTSGSTGTPKGAVHAHAGFPLKSAIDQYLCFDVKPGDRMLWYTDMGWMMGPFLVLGALTLGASVVLYDGTPDFPTPDRLWEIAARLRVTHLGIAPTVVRALIPHGDAWPAAHDLSALRILGSTGEPWNTAPYRWFFERVGGGRAPIINYSGGTEIGGGILGCLPTLPLGPNAFHGPIPGMCADVLDAEGASVRGDVGELVVRRAWPGITQSLWGGGARLRDDARYLATYWEKNAGVWTHGDFAEVGRVADADGAEIAQWYIRGRSDDTMNVAGKRVGPTEFESVLCGHAAVREAAAIAVPDAIKGDVVVCLTVPRAPFADLEPLRAELFALCDAKLGHALRPRAILFVDELPRTRNHKMLRRVARARYLRLPDLGDLSGLENPSALEAVDSAR